MKRQGWKATFLSDFMMKSREPHTGVAALRSEKDTHGSCRASLATTGDVRNELIGQIRQKILSGYYNRESVLDDIGHGFAQALDHTL